jgi:hypothetical protein
MHISLSRIPADHAALYSSVLEQNATDQVVSTLAQ